MHRILIVSEDEFLRDLIRLSLSGLEAEFRYAAGAADMQRICRRTLFDLVILLETAPFFCGGEVIRTLRPAGLRRPSVYVISWQQCEQTVMALLECGVDQYMTFPLNLHRLRAKVAGELNTRL